MDAFKQCLINRRMFLLEHLRVSEILDYLIQDQILSIAEAAEIRAEKTHHLQAVTLLDKLHHCAPEAFGSLLNALRAVGHGFVCEELEKELENVQTKSREEQKGNRPQKGHGEEKHRADLEGQQKQQEKKVRPKGQKLGRSESQETPRPKTVATRKKSIPTKERPKSATAFQARHELTQKIKSQRGSSRGERPFRPTSKQEIAAALKVLPAPKPPTSEVVDLSVLFGLDIGHGLRTESARQQKQLKSELFQYFYNAAQRGMERLADYAIPLSEKDQQLQFLTNLFKFGREFFGISIGSIHFWVVCTRPESWPDLKMRCRSGELSRSFREEFVTEELISKYSLRTVEVQAKKSSYLEWMKVRASNAYVTEFQSQAADALERKFDDDTEDSMSELSLEGKQFVTIKPNLGAGKVSGLVAVAGCLCACGSGQGDIWLYNLKTHQEVTHTVEELSSNQEVRSLAGMNNGSNIILVVAEDKDLHFITINKQSLDIVKHRVKEMSFTLRRISVDKGTNQLVIANHAQKEIILCDHRGDIEQTIPIRTKVDYLWCALPAESLGAKYVVLDGYEPGAVHWVDAEGEVIHTYGRGEGEDLRQPEDIIQDQQGRLLVADWRNDRVHLIGQDGRLLEYFVTADDGISRPRCLFLDERSSLLYVAHQGQRGQQEVRGYKL